jgi:hypothetical protein
MFLLLESNSVKMYLKIYQKMSYFTLEGLFPKSDK